MFRVTLVFGALFLIPPNFAFLWDPTNINRLFDNSDAVFQELDGIFPDNQKTCLNEFKVFVDEVKTSVTWAVEILDVWGKAPAGLSVENRYDFGHFDRCLETVYNSTALANPPRTQHCQIPLLRSDQSVFIIGVCLTRSCTEESTSQILSRFMQNVALIVVPNRPLLCTTGDKPDFDVQQWVVLSLLIVLAVLLISSTIYDTVKTYQGRKASDLLSAFSILRNLDALLRIRNDSRPLEFLNGIRVLSMLWIVLYYAFNQYKQIVSVYNPIDLQEFQKTAGRTYVTHGDVAADTFFLVSGVLMAYNVLKSLEYNWTFNVLKFWSHRYLRLLPAFGAVILLVTTFGRYIGDGPAYQQANANLVLNCEEYWWTSVLFVQNYVNPLKLCIEPTWYISVDFQFYLIAPFIIFPLRRLGFRFIPIMTFLALGSLSFIFGYSISERFHFNFMPENYWKFIYYASHARITQWLIGIILGFLLYKKEGKKTNTHKAVTALLWIFFISLMWVVVFAPLPAYENGTADIIGFAFYQSLHRFAWASAMAWVIYACFRGLGAPLNWFLSFKIFQPLARLSYAVFLVQYPIMIFITSLQRNPTYFSEFSAFNLFINVIGLSLLLGAILTIFVEMPILNVERGLYKAYNDEDESYFDRQQPLQRSIFRIPRLRVDKKTAF